MSTRPPPRDTLERPRSPAKPPSLPPRPTPAIGARELWWWLAFLVIAAVAALAAAALLSGRNDTTAVEPEWLPEHAVDTPLVVYGEGFPRSPQFVGADANLDPDSPTWMQSEYDVDSPAVEYGDGFPRPPHYSGQDAVLDPQGEPHG